MSQTWIGFMFFAWLTLAFLVADDASKRGNNAIFWLIVTLFTGFVGMIAYLLFRGPNTQESAS